MGLTAEIGRGIGIDVRLRGALELISSKDAALFLDACSSAQVRVLGIEGFELEAIEIRPDMSAIADFSAIEDPLASVEEARRFVEELPSTDLFLDFTLSRASVGRP